MLNFHLPLPGDLHQMLREEAEQAGQSATSLAREALLQWLKQRRRQRLHSEIAAYAKAQAGTEFDLDEQLEEASLEVLLEESAA
jgi:plasmid stability protein